MAEDMLMLNIFSGSVQFNRKTNQKHLSSAEKWAQVSQSYTSSVIFTLM